MAQYMYIMHKNMYVFKLHIKIFINTEQNPINNHAAVSIIIACLFRGKQNYQYVYMKTFLEIKRFFPNPEHFLVNTPVALIGEI